MINTVKYCKQAVKVTLLSMACVISVQMGASAVDIPIMPVESVVKGQHGIAKTVVSGTTIEEFAVEVLGLVRGQGPSQSLVLVRTSGPLIERTGGIAAGMSGSPVYIDGKLLGAIAYGFDMADHTLGMVTPASDMLEVSVLLDELAFGHSEPLTQMVASAPNQPVPSSVAIAANAQEEALLRQQLPSNTAIAVPVATPLMLSGLGERTRALVEPALRKWNVLAVPAGKAPTKADTPTLEPGSAFGVQLVRGDVEMTAIGTVTFLTEQGFVGFGHPYMNRGNVDFFATGAYIHEVVRSIESPFKMGAPLDAVGRLTQDRGAGVAAQLGSDPEFLNVQVAVNDRSLGRSKQFQAQVVYDESLTVPLVAITLLEAMDRALDRIGQGTAMVKATMDGNGIDNPITRENMFYSSSDISAASLSEMIAALQKLVGNDLAWVRLRNLSFTIDVETERRTARVEKVLVHNTEVQPGGTVDMDVYLRPYRESPVKMSLRLTVPEDAPAGEVSVLVSGGGYGIARIPVGEVAAKLDEPSDEDDDDSDDITPASDFKKFLADLFDGDRNYELVAEYYPVSDFDEDRVSTPQKAAPPTTTEKNGKDTKDTKEAKDTQNADTRRAPRNMQPNKAKVATTYYIQGSIEAAFTILPAESNKKPESDSKDIQG